MSRTNWYRIEGSAKFLQRSPSCGSVEPLFSPAGRGAFNGARSRTRFTEDLTANGKSPLFIRFANAKLGPTPELKKSEVSRNFLSFRVVWGSEYRL